MADRKVVVETFDLRKEYGDAVAVDDLNLQLKQGDIFGLIGPNGAGKTTTIKMLATLLKPSSGSAYISGHDVVRSPEKVREVIGYMPDFFGVYGDLKVWEYLSFFAAAYKIPRQRRIGLIEDVLELTDLKLKRESYVRDLSRGMRQRLCLAKTLIHDPEVLLLDEPASGLDPKARFEIREILKELGNMGKTILISSNIIPELANFCSRIGMIEQGKLLVSGDLESIISQLDEGVMLTIRIHSGMENAMDILSGRSDIEDIDSEEDIIKLRYMGEAENIHEILTELVTGQVQVSSFHTTELDMEDAFLRLTKGAVS